MIKKDKQASTPNLTPEELTEFKQTYEGYQKAIYDLGLLEVDINKTKQKLDELNNERADLLSHIGAIAAKQQEISNKLGDKYGDKQVDLETGELK